MSSEFFPTLPGRAKVLSREPIHRVDVFGAESGNEQRIKRGLVPLHRFRVQYGFLRTAAVYRELQKLAGLYARHAGPWDSFLWRDPEDHAVADHGFGVGNGTATSYQLQRAHLGGREDVLGAWETYTKPRTNLCLNSRSWSTVGTGASVASNAAVAPDGFVTASRVTYDGTGAVGAIRVYCPTGHISVPGATYTASYWIRAEVPVTVQVSSNLNAITVAAGPEWTRFAVTSIGDGVGSLHPILRSPPGVNTAFTVEVWQGQAETGSSATAPIITTGAAARKDPAYWPALGDGFEPVLEPGPDLVLAVEDDGLGRRPLARVPRTNGILHSQNMAEAAWLRNGIASVVVGATAPDGSASAATITEDTTTNDHHIYRSGGAVAGRQFVHIAYLKAGTCSLGLIRTGGTIHRAFFALATGTVVGTPLNCTAGIEAVGNGWFRAWIAGTATASSAGAYAIGMAEAGPTQGYPGTSRTLLAWGAHSENDTLVAGDYIQTTTAAVTRTDATLGSAGLAALAVAPRVGAALSWSGSFYRRVRFAERGVSFERWLAEVWRTGVVELVEVLS